jgi:transcriptional regulator with XRE-family HTH domain
MARRNTGFGREHLRALGRRLRELREARSWSLKRLAAESGISVAAIQKIEAGEASPSLLTTVAIAEVLGEPVDRLIAASRKASRAVNVARGVLPVQASGSATLEPRLAQPRMHNQLIALPGLQRLDPEDLPSSGALLAYVLEGALRLAFADGQTERLATGDAIHAAGELPVEWANPLARRSLVLCIADRRGDLDQLYRRSLR